MQLSTKPGVEIRESGRMFCLCSEGRVIGFAASLGFAETRAKELGVLSSVASQITDESTADPTNVLTFGSQGSNFWHVEVVDIESECGAFRIAAFPTAAEAWQFRDKVEAYNRSMPESGADGEWSESQIVWFKAHPAALAYGGVLRVRYQGGH